MHYMPRVHGEAEIDSLLQCDIGEGLERLKLNDDDERDTVRNENQALRRSFIELLYNIEAIILRVAKTIRGCSKWKRMSLIVW